MMLRQQNHPTVWAFAYVFRILLQATVLLPQCVHCLSTPASNNNHRHVCLLNDYEAVRGPYFYALFDQLWEQTGFANKRVAFLAATGVEAGSNQGKHEEQLANKMQQIQQELDLDTCELFTLSTDNIDPEHLREKLVKLEPSIVWIAAPPKNNYKGSDGDDDDYQPHNDGNGNSYWLRHVLRIHNADGIIHDLCGPPATDDPARNRACLFVGEGSGALCAGSNMAVAALRGDDPKKCPELQFRGLSVLGPTRSVSFEKLLDRSKTAEDDPFDLIRLQDKLSKQPLYNPEKATTIFLNPKQVYVFSQVTARESNESSDDDDEETTNSLSTTSLIFNPYQRGAIEQYESEALKPVPPLSVGDTGSSSVARMCTGEPSEDPSRTIHTSLVDEGDYY